MALEPAMPPPAAVKMPGVEVIPGYQLMELLGSGGFGEVWKCAAPGGIDKAIKFVQGLDPVLHEATGPVEQELHALQRIKDIRHPFLLSLDRVEMIGDELAIVMELADQSLHDRLIQCRRTGQPGIPRAELLGYLEEAAEVLDVMNLQYGLQHLDIKPPNLFLVHCHVKVGDFGLVQGLRGPSRGPGRSLGGITPQYAAPETFVGNPSSNSDQYSLAITYQELLTGTRPFAGSTPSQLALQHAHEPPHLTPLPSADQPIVARALAKDPQQRFPSCRDFVKALMKRSAFIPRTGKTPANQPERVNVNRAKQSQLMKLPGIGRALAKRILAYREAHGPFGKVEDLRRIQGIGPVVLNRLRKYVLLETAPPGDQQADSSQDNQHPDSMARQAIKTPCRRSPSPEAELEAACHKADTPWLPPQAATQQVSDLILQTEIANSAHRTPSFLPGYPLGNCLNRTSLREVWEVYDAQGVRRQARRYFGCVAEYLRTKRDPAVRLQALRHPVLPAMEVAPSDPGTVVLLMPPVFDSLLHRFHECQAEGLPGIPREELLDYLGTTAEALDYLWERHEVAHLGLNPDNLLLAKGRVMLADFGVAQWFWLPAGQALARLNARYAAPELLRGEVSSACDQYSLALIFQELFTGSHAFGSTSEPPKDDETREPDLHPLPASDRAIFRRALARDPRERFGKCTELIDALAEESLTRSTFLANGASPAAETQDDENQNLADPISECWRQVIAQMVKAAAGPWRVHESGPTRFLLQPHKQIQHACSAWLPLAVAIQKMDSFGQEWQARISRPDETTFLLHVPLPIGRGFWQWFNGRQPQLRLKVQLRPPRTIAGLSEINIEITPEGCGRKQSDRLLREFGPVLVERLRDCLNARPDQRREPRVLWQPTLQVRPVAPGGELGEAITCKGKDISLHGIGLYLPEEPCTPRILVQLPATKKTPPVEVLAEIRRVQGCADGWREIGARFVPYRPSI